MAQSFLESIFCGRVTQSAASCEKSNSDLAAQVADLQVEVTNLTREKQTLIGSCDQTTQENVIQIASLESQISNLTNQINTLNQQINQNIQTDPLFSQNFSRLPAATQKVAVNYLQKYPEAYVRYNGRYVGKNMTMYPLDVKAFLSQGKNDWQIASMVKACKGRVSDVLAEQPNISFHRACDIAFMRVTHALGDSVQYTYDETTWGAVEFWQFASETRFLSEGDCEDKALFNYIGATIAGIPDELLRIGAGMTNTNEGHCSNFYLASDLQMHHRNSTTNYAADVNILDLPLSGDPNEPLNFKNFWFSANAQYTWNWFATAATKAEAMTLKGDLFLKFIEIFDKDMNRVI